MAGCRVLCPAKESLLAGAAARPFRIGKPASQRAAEQTAAVQHETKLKRDVYTWLAGAAAGPVGIGRPAFRCAAGQVLIQTNLNGCGASFLRAPLPGLSGLADLHLGVPLDKQLQCCAWEERPLSQQQLEYAAADAVCLLHIVDAMVTHVHLSVTHHRRHQSALLTGVAAVQMWDTAGPTSHPVLHCDRGVSHVQAAAAGHPTSSALKEHILCLEIRRPQRRGDMI